MAGIKFQGLILMSSQLINVTSDLHGSSENILRAEDIHNNMINIVICYKSTNKTAQYWDAVGGLKLHESI